MKSQLLHLYSCLFLEFLMLVNSNFLHFSRFWSVDSVKDDRDDIETSVSKPVLALLAGDGDCAAAAAGGGESGGGEAEPPGWLKMLDKG